jgi:hypothetical protein
MRPCMHRRHSAAAMTTAACPPRPARTCRNSRNRGSDSGALETTQAGKPLGARGIAAETPQRGSARSCSGKPGFWFGDLPCKSPNQKRAQTPHLP